MIQKLILLLFLQSILVTTYAQKKMPYIIYNAKGKKVSYKKMIKSLDKKDVILFGEFHDNAIAHWLEYEVMVDLNKTNDLILGAEMIEADNQDELDQYLTEQITSEQLDTLARLWPNHDTDYAPLVNYAKEKQLRFVASNIPRRYANKVYKGGFEVLEELTDEEKSWMAPLPMPFDPEIKTYKKILEMMGEHGSPELVMAQATKDATMAHFILKNYKANHTFLHFNGAFHSDEYEGILWYLKLHNPTLNYGTISTVSQENNLALLEENKYKADFIICVDSDMTTTY